jgi:hypothetical protein
MCRLKNLINKEPLEEVLKLINDMKSEDGVKLLQNSLSPRYDSRFVIFTGWKFDVAGTIYNHCNPTEVMKGWNLMVSEGIPVDIYVKALYISSLYAQSVNSDKRNIEVKQDIELNNVTEPLPLEILRLGYWIHKCKEAIVNKKSFDSKLKQIKGSLIFENQEATRHLLNHKLVNFGKLMKDPAIPLWERELHASELNTQLEFGPFRSNISSLIPEFMLTALILEAGFDTSFIIATSQIKTCDLLVKSYKTEIKTFLDSFHVGMKIENNLVHEVEDTLKRNKAIHDINDSLSKKAEIIFMFLTFSSMAVAFAKYTFEKGLTFSMQEAISQSVFLAEQNTLNSYIEYIPVVVCTTLIDAINCEYRIFSYTVPYPVRRNENDVLEAWPEKLTVTFGDSSEG